MRLSEVLPYPIWSRLQVARNWLAERPERARIAALRPRVPRDRIAVWTCGSASAETGRPLRGGRVKLGPLQQAFPGTAEEFNVLYLVSSALPPAAARWVQLAHDAGAVVVWNQNGIAWPGYIGRLHEFMNRPLAELLPQVDHVIFQSAYCQSSTERFVGPIWRKSEVLHNAVDTERFVPGPPLPAEPLVVVMGGTHQQLYRVEVACRAIAIVQQRGRAVRLRLAGGLDFPGGRAAAEAALAASGARDVELAGPYTRELAPSVFQSGHIALHTTYKDACPTTVVEALACGVPVVGVAAGGVPELVGEDGGLAVAVRDSWDQTVPPDPALLADGIERVAADLPRYAHGARARAVERFGQVAWLERHRALFNELLRL